MGRSASLIKIIISRGLIVKALCFFGESMWLPELFLFFLNNAPLWRRKTRCVLDEGSLYAVTVRDRLLVSASCASEKTEVTLQEGVIKSSSENTALFGVSGKDE